MCIRDRSQVVDIGHDDVRTIGQYLLELILLGFLRQLTLIDSRIIKCLHQGRLLIFGEHIPQIQVHADRLDAEHMTSHGEVAVNLEILVVDVVIRCV